MTRAIASCASALAFPFCVILSAAISRRAHYLPARPAGLQHAVDDRLKAWLHGLLAVDLAVGIFALSSWRSDHSAFLIGIARHRRGVETEPMRRLPRLGKAPSSILVTAGMLAPMVLDAGPRDGLY
jgi:hypothetical protein